MEAFGRRVRAGSVADVHITVNGCGVSRVQGRSVGREVELDRLPVYNIRWYIRAMCTISNFIFCCIMNKKEEWRSVVGYEGMYEVSNVGTIRSLNRIVSRSDGGIRNIKGKILKTRIDKNGYERVGLNKNGNSKLWLVHRIVGMAFLERRSGCDYIDHIDGNRSNNLPSNLRWCTIRK